MKITGNLGSHPRIIARSKMVANHSRAIARPGTGPRSGPPPSPRPPLGRDAWPSPVAQPARWSCSPLVAAALCCVLA
jgi:hypothetical protein